MISSGLLSRASAALLLASLALVTAGCKDKPTGPAMSDEEVARMMGAPSATQQPAPQPQKQAPQAEPEAQEPPPGTPVVISPLAPKLNDTIVIESSMPPLRDDEPTVWLLNGAPLRPDVGSGRTLSLPEAMAKKGDTIQLKAHIRGIEVFSNVIRVRNTLPDITYAKLMPETFGPGDTLYFDVKAEDPDGDTIEIRYEWKINGSFAGSARNLSEPVKRGDSFEVTATPFDGEAEGLPVRYARNATNMPPMLENHRDYQFDGTTYTYQARASDADGDPITYAISGAPEGMTIDPASGRVTWAVPQDFVGTAAYTITAADTSGGSAQMQMSFTLTLEK